MRTKNVAEEVAAKNNSFHAIVYQSFHLFKILQEQDIQRVFLNQKISVSSGN